VLATLQKIASVTSVRNFCKLIKIESVGNFVGKSQVLVTLQEKKGEVSNFTGNRKCLQLCERKKRKKKKKKKQRLVTLQKSHGLVA